MGLKEDMAACTNCDRHKTAVARKLGFGPKDFKALIVIDYPSIGDNSFVPPAGAKVLDWLFERTGFNKTYKVAYTSMVRCSGKEPTKEQVTACLPYLQQLVATMPEGFFVIIFSSFTSDGLEGKFFKGWMSRSVYFAMFKDLEYYTQKKDQLLDMWNKIF